MDFAKYLNTQAQIIDKKLDLVLGQSLKSIKKTSPEIAEIYQQFINASKNGKRLRGALVLLGFKIGGGENSKKIINAAVSFEIFQTAILAQDDVIDKSLLRRGNPSLYNALGGDDKAISQTICLSDLGFFSAFELINTLKVKDPLKIKAINLFSRILRETVLGEMLDIEVPTVKGDFREEDVIKIGLLKTARYTISGPLMLGATLAGAKPGTLKKLQLFGDNLGIAFQIQDDILGVFGNEKATGKSISSDIKEHKVTILTAFAQKKGNKHHQEVLKKYYGNEGIDERGMEKIRKVFIDTGALNYANSLAEKYFQKATTSLKGIEEPLLYSLVVFLEKRVK